MYRIAVRYQQADHGLLGAVESGLWVCCLWTFVGRSSLRWEVLHSRRLDRYLPLHPLPCSKSLHPHPRYPLGRHHHHQRRMVMRS